LLDSWCFHLIPRPIKTNTQEGHIKDRHSIDKKNTSTYEFPPLILACHMIWLRNKKVFSLHKLGKPLKFMKKQVAPNFFI
jgi:hypothetical protein